METLQPLQGVFALTVNNLQPVFHLNLPILEMEELCWPTQLPSSSTVINWDSKYSLTFSLIHEMRQLSLTPGGRFSELIVPVSLFQHIATFSILSEMWTPETSPAPSSRAPVPNPEVITTSLLLLPAILSHTRRESYWSFSCNHEWEVTCIWFSTIPFPSFLLPKSLLLHKPDLHSLFLNAWPCICMPWMHVCLLALGLASCPGCVPESLLVYHISNLQITSNHSGTYQYFQNIIFHTVDKNTARKKKA